MGDKIIKQFERIQRFTLVQAIRRSLVTLIPIIMIGSFAVLLESLPIEGYITFITTWCGGLLYNLFDMLQKVTMSMISVYVAASMGYQFGILQHGVERENRYDTMIVSLGCFFILSGAVTGETAAYGAKGVFVAIVASGLVSPLYIFVKKRAKSKQLLTDGADMDLRNSIQAIIPALITLAIVALCNSIIMSVFQTESFYQLTITALNVFSDRINKGIAGGLIYTILSDALWFLGIHGSNVLENVADPMFKEAIQQNMLLVQNGQQATEIITRQFINSFVEIGGCGSTLCLFIALLFFSKRKGTRSLMKMSMLPMLFNINEIMVFGLPIIYNPVFLIPFLLVPITNFLIAYLAMSIGLVPVVSADIQWTTPVLINGYMATGSFGGVILQLVNLTVGVCIYIPFVRLYDKRKLESSKYEYTTMVEALKQSEESGKMIQITDSAMSFGWLGKALAADLKYAYEHGEMRLFYQPQYNDADECIGVEALLRWKHQTFGWVYPPLMLKIAGEIGMQDKLEQWVMTQTLADAKILRERYPNAEIKVSVNVTGNAIQQKNFEQFLEKVAADNDIKDLKICLEITEQDALLLDDTLRDRFFRLREMGYMLAVDDFSMGSTSIRYLTDSHFELVKLDGSLVKGIMDNPRCGEIIASIVQLSNTLGVHVLAEYVSDEQIREKLLEVGCHLYQGWYYSPAIPLEELEKILDKKE